MKAAMSIYVKNLAQEDRVYLENLGLSDHEIQTYQIIVDSTKSCTAQDIANKLMVFPSAVYRVFEKLERFGLIKCTVNRPRAYEAVEKSSGFALAYQDQVSQLKHSLEATGIQNMAGSDHTHIIVGRQAVYDEYMRQAAKAKHEIGVYAIGIAYSKGLHLTQKTAIERGVYIRHVVQRVRPSNYHIIHKWQRLGVKMRSRKEEQGYHIVVIDREVALVTFSDKYNTEDRLTIVTKNPTAVRLFQAQFESIWGMANEIGVK